MRCVCPLFMASATMSLDDLLTRFAMTRMHLFRAWLAIILTLGLIGTGAAQDAQPLLAEIKSARMKGQGLEKAVNLPHLLAPEDFLPKGSVVSYTLRVDLPALADQPLGIYVRKMALSGTVYINGQLLESCERGALEQVRCLHRPYLFNAAPSLWKVGTNELRFDVYADARQSNGLSDVWVGEVQVLDSRFYRWRHWLQVDLMTGLTWLSGVLGILALAVSAVLRKDSVYLWFGLTSVFNALASGSVFMARPPMDADAFSWLVFTSRFVSGHLLILMFASFFEKLRPWVRSSVLIYVLISALVIALSDNNRTVVTVLYLPLLVAILAMPVPMLYWTWKSRQRKHMIATFFMGLVTLASSHDWFRFAGESSFVFTYLIPYSYGGVLFMFGSMLLAFLAYSLVQSQQVSAELEARVTDRTAALRLAHAQLLSSEVQRSRTQERESLLQDMHDGFGSQLVVAKMMIEKNQMSQTDLSQLLQETIADLYLVIDTLGSTHDYLSNALVDFRFRTQQRLIGTDLQVHWDIELGQVPEVSQKVVLHVLRIVQEALNNALKHAQARNIWIAASYEPRDGQLKLTIADDGVGLDDAPVRGRGQKNMMARARTVGAELSISSRRPGTQVQLVLAVGQTVSGSPSAI
jgi:signal transduction histidine kinase